MNKKNNTYTLHLKEMELKNGGFGDRSVEFQFGNHDDILDLVDTIGPKKLFQEQQDNIEFLIGLKLFSEVLLRNRKNELFAEFFPEFGKFMAKFKSHVKMADTIS